MQPISGQFGVSSAQLLMSESQELHALSTAVLVWYKSLYVIVLCLQLPTVDIENPFNVFRLGYLCVSNRNACSVAGLFVNK